MLGNGFDFAIAATTAAAATSASTVLHGRKTHHPKWGYVATVCPVFFHDVLG